MIDLFDGLKFEKKMLCVQILSSTYAIICLLYFPKLYQRILDKIMSSTCSNGFSKSSKM